MQSLVLKISRLFFRNKPRMFCRIQGEPAETSWDQMEQHEGPPSDLLLNFLVIPHYNTKLSTQEIFRHFWTCHAFCLWVRWNVPLLQAMMKSTSMFIHALFRDTLLREQSAMCLCLLAFISFSQNHLGVVFWLATTEHSNSVLSASNLIIIVSPAELMTAKEIFGMLVIEWSINLIPQN